MPVAHLGSLVFDCFPQNAIGHYETGLRIGQLSLGDDFTGVLLWGFTDNRPLLRCMHDFGLCLWRMDRFEEAEHLFDRMLWLNPSVVEDSPGTTLNLIIFYYGN